MPEISIVNPESMGRPLSLYGQIARVRASELVFISGQLATDLDGRIVGKGDFDAQMKQVLSNIEKGAKVSRGVVRQCRSVYDLSGALAGHREFPARARKNYSPQYSRHTATHQTRFGGRSARPRGFSHRNRDDRSTLALHSKPPNRQRREESASGRQHTIPTKTSFLAPVSST